MLKRFALYGFLKNQTYFEPFWILAFMEKGLSFFWIGLLFGFRGICINLFELPAGAMADLYGRRSSLVISWCGYIFSFLVFAIASEVNYMFMAMVFFAIGEVFRTGTHKAMILEWLTLNGRENDKAAVYGYTRSWSEKGAAVSVLISGLLVFFLQKYSVLFYVSVIPYIIGLVNFLSYPPELDGRKGSDVSFHEVATHLYGTLKMTLCRGRMRSLMLESMGFQGLFKTVQTYLQPAIKLVALALAGFSIMEDGQSVAVLVAVIYFILHMVSSWCAEKSHVFAMRMGGEERAVSFLWVGYLGVFVLIFTLFYCEWNIAVIACFLMLHVIQNLWRPLIVSRFSESAVRDRLTSVLSIESQAKALFVAIFAPLLGWLVDHYSLWVVGAFGAVMAVVLYLGKLISMAYGGMSNGGCGENADDGCGCDD